MNHDRPHVLSPEELHIAKERIAREYRERSASLHQAILDLKTPLGHGTTSEHLEGILENGLGAVTPENAFAGTMSATDLREPDGLLGAYLFSRFNTTTLAITSEELAGEDAISRYLKLNSKISEDRLRFMFNEYVTHRAPSGFPVVCIYEGGYDAKIAHVNENIPSEVELEEPLIKNKLRILLVPQSKIGEVGLQLINENKEVTVLPVEILEVSV